MDWDALNERIEEMVVDDGDEFDRLYEDYLRAPTVLQKQTAKAILKAYVDSLIRGEEAA